MAQGTEAEAAIVCGNPDCRIAETGRCVEGLKQEACPNFGRMPDEAETEEESDSADKADIVSLPHAMTMRPAEVSAVLRAGDARVIAIIGASDAGKTSLIASLYDLFQEGPIGEIEFARSRTLHAFEQACHDARAASRRNEPRMERTGRGEVRFYHLEMGGGTAATRMALALGDRAGEEYREAADDLSLASAFVEIRRANTVTVLVDGERLLDSGARHNLRSEVTLILQALCDGAAAPDRARLALVLTKLDLITASPHRARASQDFDRLAIGVRDLFGSVFPVIETFKVAASPKTAELRRGEGVSDLLLFWLQPPIAPPQAIAIAPAFDRAFARLQPLEE